MIVPGAEHCCLAGTGTGTISAGEQGVPGSLVTREQSGATVTNGCNEHRANRVYRPQATHARPMPSA